MGVRWCLIVVLVCVYLMTDERGHFLMCLLAICILYLEKCLFRTFAHFLIRLSFYCSVVRPIYIFGIVESGQIYGLWIHFLILWVFLSILMVFFGA